MKGKLLLLLLQGVLLYETLAWEVRMPKEIHGLEGSCLVIPCSFSYTSYPPTDPNRVVWYQWVSKGYPSVFDPWKPSDVIDKFRGKTRLYGNPSNRDCSLLITNLDQSHHGEKLYTWIDPENVGKSTYRFYDVTSTIFVDASPQEPTINIYGGGWTGDTITVTCFTYHSCPYSKPNIILKGIEGSDKTEDVNFNNGQWKITLTRTGVVKAERSDIECTVTHYGGKRARATKSQSAKCISTNITIKPEREDLIEGVAKDFTCTIDHSCQKDPPTISWNYKNMKVSNGNKKLTEFKSAASSTITFVGTKEDNGKKLKCTANISGKNIDASVILRVQHSVTEPPKPVNPVQNSTLSALSQGEAQVMTFDWKTTGLYIIVSSSFILLLVCTLAGVFIYKSCHRPSPVDTHEQRSNVHSKSAYEPFSKPHMPSPKSQRKSCSINDYEDYYTNVEDLNLYGNI